MGIGLRSSELHSVPARALSFVAFDVETTGLSTLSSRLVEVALVRVSEEGVSNERFSSLVNPGTPIPEDAVRVHGITDMDVKDAPKVEEILRELSHWLREDEILVAHNAPYDLEILRMEYARAKLDAPTMPTIDTCAWARATLSSPNYKLSTLAGKLNLASDEFHRALPDAITTAKLFHHLFLSFGWDKTLTELALAIPGALILDLPSEVSFDFELPKELWEIGRALEDGSDILMVYAGGTHGLAERRVAPRTILKRGSYAYMEAWCYETGQLKTFRLDKIKSVRVVP